MSKRKSTWCTQEQLDMGYYPCKCINCGLKMSSFELKTRYANESNNCPDYICPKCGSEFHEEIKNKIKDGYDDLMDSECIKICDAFNSIPGIETTESCCGHGKTSFHIWFDIDKKYFENFQIISRIMDRRYGGFENIDHGNDNWTNTGWACETSCSDIYTKNKISFLITSREFRGNVAYKQADKIADNIYHHLKNKNFIKYFKIKLI